MKPLIKLLTLGVLTILCVSIAQATPAGLTFQGRLVKNNLSVESSGVVVTLKITSPNTDTCTLFEETHNLDMTGTDGVFSLTIGSGTRTSNDEGFTLSKVFSNTGVQINNLACATTATAYTPLSSHSRKIYISFVDGSDTVAFNEPYVIQSVPYALEAEKLAGKDSTEYLQQKNAGSVALTQTHLEAMFTTPAYTRLQSVMSGNFMEKSTTGTTLPSFTTDPSSPPEGSIWYDSTTHEVKYQSNTGPLAIGAGSNSGATNGGNAVTSTMTLGTNSNHAMAFETNGTPRMTISNSGDIGIGTTTPASLFQVGDSGGFSFSVAPVGSADGMAGISYSTDMRVAMSPNGNSVGWPGAMGMPGIRIGMDPNYSYLVVDGSGNLMINGAAGGNVGIGLTVPTEKLEVDGNIKVKGSNEIMFNTNGGISYQNNYASNSGADTLVFSNGSTEWMTFKTSGAAPINFFTSNTERMRIASDGKIGIGVSNSGSDLEVKGTTTTDPIFKVISTGGLAMLEAIDQGWGRTLYLSDGSTSAITLGPFPAGISMNENNNSPVSIHANGNSGSTTATLTIGSITTTFTNPSTKVGIGGAPSEVLDVVGNIKASGCLYYDNSNLGNCASDEKLKKDVHSFNLGLDTLLGLNPVYFKYNGLGGFKADGKEQLGVIAQDVEKHSPALVKTKLVQMHEDDQEKTEVKSVDYGSFTYVLINAVKELHQKWFDDSAQLHAQMDELKTENAALKSWICSEDPSADICQ